MTTSFLETLAEQLSFHLNKEIIISRAEQVYGGDINNTFIFTTSDGKYFLKTNDHAADDMFEKEFNGLHLLKKAQCIEVPEPVLSGEADGIFFIVMECIGKGRPTVNFWRQFAEGLAGLHKQTHPLFGLHEDNYIGSLQQQNNYQNEWAQFYSSRRILPLIEKAFDEDKCSKKDIANTETLCAKFNVLFPIEPPSLLHGDLWSGNFMVSEKGLPVIYDPAVYYGHREMDIAMTLLFGGFDQKLYQHYDEVFPLEKGWQQRIELCQLYPLLVHLVLFGGHYYHSVMNIVKKYG